jgi:SNF2 family DNA or RNA helicase
MILRIATYSQVERDYKLYKSEKEGSIGPLFEVEFYRIILDEGDNIKNCYGNSMFRIRSLYYE